MNQDHVSDYDLERYHLGMVVAENELAALEEHLLICPTCVDRAEEAAKYVDSVRAAASLLPAEELARPFKKCPRNCLKS